MPSTSLQLLQKAGAKLDTTSVAPAQPLTLAVVESRGLSGDVLATWMRLVASSLPQAQLTIPTSDAEAEINAVSLTRQELRMLAVYYAMQLDVLSRWRLIGTGELYSGMRGVEYNKDDKDHVIAVVGPHTPDGAPSDPAARDLFFGCLGALYTLEGALPGADLPRSGSDALPTLDSLEDTPLGAVAEELELAQAGGALVLGAIAVAGVAATIVGATAAYYYLGAQERVALAQVAAASEEFKIRHAYAQATGEDVPPPGPNEKAAATALSQLGGDGRSAATWGMVQGVGMAIGFAGAAYGVAQLVKR